MLPLETRGACSRRGESNQAEARHISEDDTVVMGSLRHAAGTQDGDVSFPCWWSSARASMASRLLR